MALATYQAGWKDGTVRIVYAENRDEAKRRATTVGGSPPDRLRKIRKGL